MSSGRGSLLRIEFAQASDPGRDPNKQVNEDSCGYSENKFGHLLVLCDGMGGHHGGQEASRLAITTIFEVMDQLAVDTPPGQALKVAIEEAARRVYTLGGPPENRARPGSTVVAMVLHDGGADVAHVGDSRSYIIRSNQIYPLTRDHSMVQGMIDAGMLSEAQAIGHPDSNKITRALGMKTETDVEVRPEPMELFAGDVLLLASDGLTDLALAADILGAVRQSLNSGSIEHACKQLVQMANDRGGHDNITVQMARVVDTGPKRTRVPEAQPTRQQAPTSQPGYAGQPVAPTLTATPPHAASQPVAHGPPQGPWSAAPARAETVVDRAAGPAQTAPGDPAAQSWSSGMYRGPDSLNAYRLDAIPPPPPPAQAGYGPMGMHGHLPPTPMPPSVTGMDGQPSRGGLVALVVGLSAFIAVLLLVLIWALFLR
jgi:serine/threonine protein phosphatase PrpC